MFYDLVFDCNFSYKLDEIKIIVLLVGSKMWWNIDF